ncbi:flippase-like domain-containing protein [Streptomyces sp. SID12501]|uniref:Flippase-like domain-containing protein n=1 Tax=Streptomyces sp. SID12501 TaxID=2706042 RepID=A0A6B3BMZ4_9ACTN|nr:lysylphosphatidylglycerol synthase transmembrane domain-containing protein [Streptomyces sp. SID12501]NEC85816.1 flippase-like domain-containing protein [Streptomyces sp. SID12501]
MSVQTVEVTEAVLSGFGEVGRGPAPLKGRGELRDQPPLARGRRTAYPEARSSAGRAGVIGFVGPREAAPQATEPSRLRRAAKSIRPHLGTLAGVTILGVLLWRLGTGVFLDGLRRIDVPILFVGLGIGLLTTVFSAWRWALVARGLGIKLPLVPAIADYYRSLFLNAALPGGVLGDVHRAVRHGQSAGDMGRGVRAVVLERVAGQIALITVGGVVLLTQPSPVLADARRVALMAVFAVVGAVAVVVAVRMNRAPSVAARRARALRAALTEARGALLSRENLPGVALSSVVVLSGHLGMFVVAARVAGSHATVAELLPLAVLALLAMGIPLNVGGWGPREGVTAWAFGAAGLGASMGLSVAVVYGVLSFVAALPGAVVLVVRYFWSPTPPASAAAPATASASASVSIEKYAPKDSAKLASNALPFSAEPSEGRPMTPESV